MPAESSLNIWCNYPLDEAATSLLRAGTRPHHLVLHERTGTAPAVRDAADAAPEAAQILFGQPEPSMLLTSRSVRWVHLTSAGFTRYDRDDVRAALQAKGAMLTNSSHVFDEPCAQHLAAMMLALARQLPQCLDNQRGARTWLQNEKRGRASRLLTGQTAFIYGFGAIARRLVEILAPWRMHLVGVRRSARGDEGIPILTEGEADARLGEADHILDILPDNASTRRFFGSERFARCKPGARFYNIGRGTTVDQEALAAALGAGQLGAAYLDVTDPEPLPPGHALWNAPNCFITPHVAGAHADEDERLVRHFLANLKAFETGGPLIDRIF